MSIYAQLALAELHERFCAEAENIRRLKPKTIKWYREGFQSLLRFKLYQHARQLNELELSDFMFWGMKEQSWKERTLMAYYNSLNSFFNWCVKKQALEVNPLKNIPRPKLPQQLPKALSQADAVRLFECVQIMPVPKEYKPPIFHKRRNIAIFAMFLFTGIRRQELIDLKFTDINLEEETVSVRDGKGGKDRIIPMSPELKLHLQKYIEEREKLEITASPFFISHHYQTNISDSTLKRLFKRVIELSGIHFSAHKLRHTFATLMVRAKCDVLALSKMMGHSSIKTTMIYMSASDDHLKEQINNHPLNFL